MNASPTASPAGISCVIPVYNEAGVVQPTIEGVAAALEATGRPFEIIVVDDGSTDGTLEAAKHAKATFRSLAHPRNRGYGASIKTGCRAAAHPWILIIDADGSYPPEEIGKLVKALDEDEGLDMIVGQRRQSLATDGFFRLQGKAILIALANFLAGMKIPDLNSGLRLMRRSHVERFKSILSDGFSLTTSITLALLCSGAWVRYVPIEYRRRHGQSKIRPIRDMGNFTILILRTSLYFNPLKLFVPLGGIFLFAAVAVTILSKVLTGQVMDVTALFLFTTGLQMLLTGIIADLVLKSFVFRDK